QDVDESLFAQLLERGDDGKTTDELRDQTELQEIFRLHLSEQLTKLEVALALHVSAKAEPRLAEAARDDLVETDKRTTTDEEDVAGVDLEEILLRVLAAALGRNVRDGYFDDLEQGL